jgi:Protein of unknown function (DUF2891)
VPALPPCNCALGSEGDTLWPLLANTIAWGISAPLDHEARDPDLPDVFGGSFDRHSCIHAHWALLSLYRTVGDTTQAAVWSRRLSDTVLWDAWRNTQANPLIPSYRNGWFLLLLSELAQHGRTGASFTALRTTAEQALCTWLQANAGNDGLLAWGQHESWLFAFLLLQLSAPDPRSNAVSVMNALYGSTVSSWRQRWRNLPSIIETLDLLRGQPPWLTSAMVASFGLGAAGITPGHAVGERITHAWPVAVLARTDATMCGLLQQFVRDWLAQPTNWQYQLPTDTPATQKARFRNNSHWTPQFLWMALRLRCP